MVDIDSALLGVQERDNWRRRMEVLERSLGEVRGLRRKAENRMRRVRRELARLRVTTDALADRARTPHLPEIIHGTAAAPLRNR